MKPFCNIFLTNKKNVFSQKWFSRSRVTFKKRWREKMGIFYFKKQTLKKTDFILTTFKFGFYYCDA
jgi:hypothetical protein